MSIDPKAIAGLFEVSRDAVLGVMEDKILFLNPSAAALFQAKPGDPAGNHIPSYILTDPASQFVASVHLNDRAGYGSACRFGDFLLICFVLPPEEDAVSPILSGSVREFSNALMATRLAADVILKQLDSTDNEKLRTHSAILYQSYYRMKRLCEHISKADCLYRGTLPFNPCVVAIDRICMELCDSMNHFLAPMGVSLEFEAGDGNYNTLADQSLLGTLLMNAVTNSVAHLPAGKQGRVRIRLSTLGDRIILSIDDNGTGIPMEKLSPLLTGSVALTLTDTAAGAGLGIMVSRGIAELHGGALILESREGQGTKLRVSLPVRLPEDPTLRTPVPVYNKEGMSHILTELSVILDKKFYNKTLFD